MYRPPSAQEKSFILFLSGGGVCAQASLATSNVIFHLSCFSRNIKLVNNNKIQCTLNQIKSEISPLKHIPSFDARD